MKKVVSVYVDPEGYSEMKRTCQNLGISVSSKLDELIKNWLQEAAGKKFAENPLDYEGLKRKHMALGKERDKLEKELEKHKVFDDLYEALEKTDIDAVLLSNLPEVAPKLAAEWMKDKQHRKEDVHLFITFLELVRERKLVELQLDQMRQVESGA